MGFFFLFFFPDSDDKKSSGFFLPSGAGWKRKRYHQKYANGRVEIPAVVVWDDPRLCVTQDGKETLILSLLETIVFLPDRNFTAECFAKQSSECKFQHRVTVAFAPTALAAPRSPAAQARARRVVLGLRTSRPACAMAAPRPCRGCSAACARGSPPRQRAAALGAGSRGDTGSDASWFSLPAVTFLCDGCRSRSCPDGWAAPPLASGVHPSRGCGARLPTRHPHPLLPRLKGGS